ncbi:MAG: hypothetical protein ACPGL0_11085 [Limisphaerales bacterium]
MFPDSRFSGLPVSQSQLRPQAPYIVRWPGKSWTLERAIHSPKLFDKVRYAASSFKKTLQTRVDENPTNQALR